MLSGYLIKIINATKDTKIQNAWNEALIKLAQLDLSD
jgi:hypothetical protein